jgi:hypothetical protein
MVDQDPAPVTADDELLVETGNYPEPDDGPQDEVEQTNEPGFDEALVDGVDLAETT